jgi:endonuclease/exonuclease/phosphatase family metal-dependent hydrolase
VCGWVLRIWTCGVAAWMMLACQPSVELAVAPTPSATPRETITVMTYNILDGSGVGPTDPEGPWCCGPPALGCCHAAGGNRLPRILEIIRLADPDILGLQEAYLWQVESHGIARDVAAELGMDYFIGESESKGGAHVALFTRFPIVAAESYPGHFEALNPRGGLHAELVTGSGQHLHVFVVHLKYQPDEVSFLLEQMQPFFDFPAVLMGDMNFTDPSELALMLHDAGWRHPLAHQQYIDQVWTSPQLEPNVRPGAQISPKLTMGASDHAPVVVEIGLP